MISAISQRKLNVDHNSIERYIGKLTSIWANVVIIWLAESIVTVKLTLSASSYDLHLIMIGILFTRISSTRWAPTRGWESKLERISKKKTKEK